MRRFIAALAGVLLAATASAQVVSQGPSGFQTLFTNGASSGNGADLTSDVLTTCSTYSLPAGQLANVGDVIHITAGGTLAASTDLKTVAVRIGGTVVASGSSSATGGSQWVSDTWLMKTGPSTQTYGSDMLINNQGVGILSNTLALTDTGALTVTVTGQNATNSVAGSVTCRLAIVQYLH